MSDSNQAKKGAEVKNSSTTTLDKPLFFWSAIVVAAVVVYMIVLRNQLPVLCRPCLTILLTSGVGYISGPL